MRSVLAAAAVAALVGPAAAARAQAPDRFSLLTVLSIDHAAGENTADQPNVVADVLFTARLGAGWTAYVRPWIRQPRRAEVDWRLYQAAVRWERPADVSLRLDAGYIVSPVGMGLFDSSAAANPTMLAHLAYFIPMPAFDPGAPRLVPIASTYPLGAVLTASTERWDGRAAVVDGAPTRIYTVGGPNPAGHTPVVEAGAGITPRVGLRIGASFAHGAYATRDETTGGSGAPRMVTLTGLEAEWAFRYTKIAGEFVHDRFATPFGTTNAQTWFVQAQQTLTPRWFAAARHEGASAPPLLNGIAGIAPGTRTAFRTAEAILGYKLTRGVTVRGGYYGRKNYTTDDWDHQAGASLVWSERWR